MVRISYKEVDKNKNQEELVKNMQIIVFEDNTGSSAKLV